MSDITFIVLLETQKYIQELARFGASKCRITKRLKTFDYNLIQNCFFAQIIDVVTKFKNKSCSVFFSSRKHANIILTPPPSLLNHTFI